MSYHRPSAIIYAGCFYDKVCHDGRVATKKGYPTKANGVNFTGGMPFSDIGAIDREADCSHFVSCCIGQTRGKIAVGGRDVEVRGGGLPVPSPFKNIGVYGETYVPALVQDLIMRRWARFVDRQFLPTHDGNTRNTMMANMQPGDLLAYASKDHAARYEHMCILVTTHAISCHTTPRFNKDYTDIYYPWVSLLKMA